jgi:hypothetical protein
LPKILGLLSDLFSHFLSPKYSQDNYSITNKSTQVQDYLQQARIDSLESRGPQQPPPQPTHPPPIVVSPAESGRHQRQPGDPWANLQSEYLQKQGS